MAHIKLTSEEREEKKENIRKMAKEMGIMVRFPEDVVEERLEKLPKLFRAWCKTNRREMTPEDFFHKVRELFEDEVLEVWNKKDWHKLEEHRVKEEV